MLLFRPRWFLFQRAFYTKNLQTKMPLRLYFGDERFGDFEFGHTILLLIRHATDAGRMTGFLIFWNCLFASITLIRKMISLFSSLLLAIKLNLSSNVISWRLELSNRFGSSSFLFLRFQFQIILHPNGRKEASGKRMKREENKTPGTRTFVKQKPIILVFCYCR